MRHQWFYYALQFPTFQSSKPLKGAWSHYPPAPSLKSFLARVRTCTALLDKARRSLQCSFAQTDTSSMHRLAFVCAQSTSIYFPMFGLGHM